MSFRRTTEQHTVRSYEFFFPECFYICRPNAEPPPQTKTRPATSPEPMKPVTSIIISIIITHPDQVS